MGVVGVGRSPGDNWQPQQPDGLDVRYFAIDGVIEQVMCPAGYTSVRWTPGHDKQGNGQASITIQFDPNDVMD